MKKVTVTLCLFFTLARLFAAAPINESSLYGAAAAEARLKLLAAAESCLGVPYRYAGFDHRGLDCSGLVYFSFKEGPGYTIPRSAEGIYAWSEKILSSELQPGDLVFFVTSGTRVSHVGIYAGGGSFIHSASEGPRTGVIYSKLGESYWSRTYKGAGRALPWDEAAASAMTTAASASGEGSSQPVMAAGTEAGQSSGAVSRLTAGNESPVWTDTGFFTGFGAAWTWGGYMNEAYSPFRGLSALASLGYKTSGFRFGLEIRPELDQSLGVFRLPFALSAGNDIFQVFAGPAYTFGEPALKLADGERRYSGGGEWLWGAGVSAAFPAVKINRGALSFYGELAWHFYPRGDSENFSLKNDLAANLRLSTGIRYLWLMGS